jgi:hypothetical protein
VITQDSSAILLQASVLSSAKGDFGPQAVVPELEKHLILGDSVAFVNW